MGTRKTRLIEAVLTCNHNVWLEQKLEKLKFHLLQPLKFKAYYIGEFTLYNIFSLQVKALSGKVGDRKLILINYPDAMGDNFNPVMDIIDVNAAKKLRQLDGIEGGQYGDRIIYKK